MDNPKPPTLVDAREPFPSDSGSRIDSDSPPLRWREIVCLLAIVLLADIAIYRGEGYAGWAAILGATPILLLTGAARKHYDPALPIVGLMLALLEARLVWCGSTIAVVSGGRPSFRALRPSSLSGRRPYVLDAISFAAALAHYGGRGLAAYGRQLLRYSRPFAASNAIVVVIPAVVGAAFCVLFVLANPDLVESFSRTLSHALERLQSWLSELSVVEGLFLFGVCPWIAVGF